MKEAIRRLNPHAEAGADLRFADALLAKDDIALVTKEVAKPPEMEQRFLTSGQWEAKYGTKG